ncbi:MAG: pyruvate dehydrogenase [Chloroflexi bacterium]|nr:pyruvate dehydrogenase [Chloroflexota bacterium]
MLQTTMDWRAVARYVLTSRTVDQLEETELAPNGKVTYQFSARGHELAQALLGLSLDHPHDAAGVYYRSRPLLFASGLSVGEALAGSMAKAGSPTGGRDIGVVHMLDRRGRALVLPTAGDVGSQYTPAVGWAQAIRYHQRVLHEDDWAGSIVVACGGDGSTAANGFWAALNIVTTQNLPYLFFIEDNAYGISVPSAYQTPGGDIAKNLASFGNLCVLEGDGTDPIEAASKIDRAVSHVRANNGPALLRLSVPRLNGHSFVDNQSYKAKDLREAEAARDPLLKLKAYLITNSIMADDEWTQLEAQVEREVRAACDAVLAQPEPDPATATRHVFYEGTAPHPPSPSPEIVQMISGEGEGRVRLNLLDAVKRTLEVELIANPRLLIFGEDVGVKGGVHGATTDMQLKYGAERVLDTSLNEDGIIGRSAGLAFAGLMPVPEIQFRKYADPAMEQINNIGTLRWRTLGKFAAPMVVRIPVGFGRKTGDPWHSVSGEAVHAKSLGWRIAIPSNAEDAVGLLRTALRGNDPTFFYEHRALLDTAPARRPYPGDDYVLPFGVASVIASGDDLTVVTWGAMVHRCAEAAAAEAAGRGKVTSPLHGIEIIDLRTIVPWDRSTVLKSIAKTGKCLIVHEDGITGGFGAEIAATIAQEAFFDLDAPIVRVATLDVPIPYNANLMHAVTPTVEKIRAEMERLMRL